jgi:hypothetical protein
VTLVPINVNVLIAGEDEAKTFQADLTKKYNLIEDESFGGAVQNSLFSTQATEAGVHLHFLMPDALLHGTARDDSIIFPELPNRWIIQRIDEKKNVRAWLVASDFISKDSILPNKTNRVSVPKLSPGTGKPFFYMGDYRDEDSPPQTGGAAAASLTAALAGDPVFTAFYPSCRTIFGFYDNMEGVAGTFTYLVTGYYSDAGKDPLRVYTADSLAWDGTGAPRCLFHGFVGGVTWSGPGHNYTALPEGDVSLCVGNTSAEGLSAYIADVTETPSLERVLTGLQYGILDELDDAKDTDAILNFEEMIHEKEFETRTKNYEWVIKNTAVTEVAADKLRALNKAQKDCDALEEQIAALQDEAFFSWYKYVKTMDDHFSPSPHAPEYLAKAIEKLDVLKGVKNQLGQIKADIGSGSAALSALAKGLVRVPSSAHYLPNEPALLFVGDGVARAFAQGFQTRDGRLPCRAGVEYDKSTLSGMTLNFTRFTGGDAELENAVKSVLAEIFVKSKTPPFEIAAKTYAPPWQPLLMEWETELAPYRDKPDDTLSHFSLSGDDADFIKVSDIQHANPLIVSGTTLLTPHAAINISEVINRYLATHSKDAYTEILSELAGKFKNLNALSQTLCGFNDFLLMRKPLFKLPVYSDDQKEMADKFKRLVDYNALCEPMPEQDMDLVWKKNQFAPFRAGVLEVKRLWIVDSFGQHKRFTAKTPEFDNYRAFKKVYISENIKVQDEKEPGKALFPPRLAVPARVCLEFDACSGYVIPDFLDAALQVYTPEAVFAGIFTEKKWTLKTGAVISSAMESFLASFETNPLRDFMTRLEKKLSNRMTPGGAALFADCFGIPLALITAKLSVQHAFSPRIILWNVEDGEDYGFLSTPFPLMIGDSRRRADGIAEYFTGGDYCAYSPDVSASLGGPPVDIAFLSDPRGKIFIRTGLLPAYSADIPAPDMSGAEFYFRSPLVADGSDFKIPTPDMPLAWSFKGIATGRPDISLPTRAQSMFEGYLKGVKNE